MTGRNFLLLVALLVADSGLAFVNTGRLSFAGSVTQSSKHNIGSPWGYVLVYITLVSLAH
jgi:hypothetical protein